MPRQLAAGIARRMFLLVFLEPTRKSPAFRVGFFVLKGCEIDDASPRPGLGEAYRVTPKKALLTQE